MPWMMPMTIRFAPMFFVFRSPGEALYGPLTGDSLRFVEKLWINCVILQFYPQKICSLHHFTIAAEELKVDYTPRDSEFTRSCADREAFGRNGPGTRKPSGGTVRDQKALGRSGPRVRKPSGGMAQGSGNLKEERSKGQEAFGWNDPRIRKSLGGTVREEASGVFFGARCMDPASAHLAPLSLRACLVDRCAAQFGGRPPAACPRGAEHSRERPGAIPAQRASEPRRALGVSIRLRTPRPCTGGQVLTGNDSACQLNFVSKRRNLSICWVFAS